MEAVAEIAAAVKNVPALRFPEFEGEWDIKRLGEFLKERVEYTSHELPLYSLTIEGGIVPKSERYERSHLVNDIEDAYKVMNQNDFAFNPMNLRFGALARHKSNLQVLVSKYYNIFYCTEKANTAYFDFYLTSYNLIQYYNKMSTGSLIEKRRVHYLDFINFKRRLPSLAEQQKIASFLTSVDDKIQQLSKKKALLEKYKKGVMQRLFKSSELGLGGLKDERISEGETGADQILKSVYPKNPNSDRLRFKDDNGNDFPEWEVKKLGEVFDFYSTNSFSRSLLNYESGSVKNIHYGDIHTQFKSNFDITKENVPFLNNDINTSKIAESSYCQVGDLVVADASEDYKDIGKAIEIINLNNENVVAGLHTYIARDKGVFALGFKGYLMQLRKVRLQMMRLATGVSVLGISKGNISKIEVGIPCLEEQIKIANFLTSIDNKITYTSKQLEQAQQFKKGLLQQLFV